jgi:hypothetical protein
MFVQTSTLSAPKSQIPDGGHDTNDDDDDDV